MYICIDINFNLRYFKCIKKLFLLIKFCFKIKEIKNGKNIKIMNLIFKNS